MSPQEIEAWVFTQIRKAPFGSSLLPALTPHEVREATAGFSSRLSQDPRLSEEPKPAKLSSLQYINAMIHASLKGPTPIELSGETRRVLVVLAHLIVGGRSFPERPSALEFTREQN
jgi:hypothetical protein